MLLCMNINNLKELVFNGLTSGILAGLICALLTWILKPVPRIKISKEVAYNKEKTKYRYKIQNKGLSDIGISGLYLTLCYKGEFYNLKGIDVPFIHSKTSTKETGSDYTYERLFEIDVSLLKPEQIRKSGDKELIKKLADKELVLHDFINNDENFKIYVGLQAVSYRFNTTRYYKETLKQWTEGEFERGKCHVEKGNTPIAD